VEKILLALLVAVIGSLVLPATLLARVFVSWPVKPTQGRIATSDVEKKSTASLVLLSRRVIELVDPPKIQKSHE